MIYSTKPALLVSHQAKQRPDLLDPMETKPKILVLFAHPAQSRSEVNLPLYHIALDHKAVTAVDLYAEYPDFNINIEREQQRLCDHDVIIFLYPLFWYSTPALLKEWQDLVLEYGFAYGHKGKALAGKYFFCAVSAGGEEKAYQTDGFNHFTIRQLLQPLEQMASITNMIYLAPFTLFGSRTAREQHRVTQHKAKWRTLLDKLLNNKLDIQRAQQIENLADLCQPEGKTE